MKKMKKMLMMMKLMLVAVMAAGMFWGVELEAQAESGMQVLENTLHNVDGMKATVEHDAATKTIKVKIDATNYNLDVGGTYEQILYRPSVSVYGVGGQPGWTEPAYESVRVNGLTTEVVYKYENANQLYGIYDLKFDVFQLYHTKDGFVETNLYCDSRFDYSSYIRVMFPMTSGQSVSYSAKIDKVVQDGGQIYEYGTNGSCSVTANEYNFRGVRLKAKADFGAGLTPDIGYDYTYSWTLPNGGTSSAQEVDVLSNGPGTYKVQVTATRKSDISGEWIKKLGYQDNYSSETTINVVQNGDYSCEVKWDESTRNAGNKISVGAPLNIVVKLGNCGSKGATFTLYKNNETVGSWHVTSAYTSTIKLSESVNSTYAGEYTWALVPKANLFSEKSGATENLTVEKIHSKPTVSITEAIPQGVYVGTITMNADVPGSFTISSTDGTTILVPEKTYNFTGEEISVKYEDLVQGNPANGTYSLSYTFVPENTSDYFSAEEGTLAYSIKSQSTIEVVQGVPGAAGYVSVDGKTSGSFYWDINKPVTITVTSIGGILGNNVSSKITGITVDGEPLSDVTISADKLSATGSFTPTVSGKTYTVSATYDYKKMELKNRATFYLDEEITAANLDKIERELFKAIIDTQNSYLPSLNYDEMDVAVQYLAGTDIMGSGIYYSLNNVPPVFATNLHAFGNGSPERVNITLTIDGATLKKTLVYVNVVKRSEPTLTVSSSSIELARGDSMLGDMKSAIGAKIEEVSNVAFAYVDKEGNAITDNYLKNAKANEPFEVTVKFAGNTTYKPASKTVTVVVKERLNVSDIEKEYVYLAGSRGTEIIDIAAMLPTDIQNVTYTFAENSAEYIVNESFDTTGKLSYEVNNQGAIGNTSELIITVSSDNYATDDIKVKVKIIDKYQLSENPDYKVAIEGSNSFVYGQALSDLVLNTQVAKFVGNGQDVAGTLAWTSPADVLDAGTTSAEWTFTPNDTEMYQTLTGTIAIDVTKRELTIDVTVADKQYDGLNTAKITSAKLNNVAEGEEILLILGTATFESVNAAENINICFTEFTLDGDSSVLKNYSLKQPAGVTANITNEWKPEEYSITELNDNGWLKEAFEIKAKEGYLLSLTNTADGVWSETLTYDEETTDGTVTFWLKNVETGAISQEITKVYKLDRTVPTGTVTMTDLSTPLKEIINKVTFGILFSKNVEINVSAEDELSGVERIEYFESETELSVDEVKEISDWTTMKNGKASVVGENGKQYIYYIRITDKAGNVTYLNTDIAQYDTVAPVISGVENGKTYYTAKNVTVSDENLVEVTLNGQVVSESFTLEGNKDATYTIIATDKANNTTKVTVTMRKEVIVDTPASSADTNKKADENTQNTTLENVDAEKVSDLETQKSNDKENRRKNTGNKKNNDEDGDKENTTQNILKDGESESKGNDTTPVMEEADKEQQVVMINSSEPAILADSPDNVEDSDEDNRTLKIGLLLLGISIIAFLIILILIKRKKEQEEE